MGKDKDRGLSQFVTEGLKGFYPASDGKSPSPQSNAVVRSVVNFHANIAQLGMKALT